MIRSFINADKIGGLITIVLGGVSLVEALRQYPTRMSFLVGDHTLPGLIGLTMVLLGVLLLITKLENFKVEFPKGTVAKKILTILIAMFAYWYLITFLGYIVSTLLILIILYRIIGSYSMSQSTLYGGLTTVALYLLFIFWLQMPFPKGILGF